MEWDISGMVIVESFSSIRYTKEVKYELLLAKPPSWGKLPGWEVPLKSPMCIAYYKESIPGIHQTRLLLTLQWVLNSRMKISSSPSNRSDLKKLS